MSLNVIMKISMLAKIVKLFQLHFFSFKTLTKRFATSSLISCTLSQFKLLSLSIFFLNSALVSSKLLLLSTYSNKSTGLNIESTDFLCDLAFKVIIHIANRLDNIAITLNKAKFSCKIYFGDIDGEYSYLLIFKLFF